MLGTMLIRGLYAMVNKWVMGWFCEEAVVVVANGKRDCKQVVAKSTTLWQNPGAFTAPRANLLPTFKIKQSDTIS